VSIVSSDEDVIAKRSAFVAARLDPRDDQRSARRVDAKSRIFSRRMIDLVLSSAVHSPEWLHASVEINQFYPANNASSLLGHGPTKRGPPKKRMPGRDIDRHLCKKNQQRVESIGYRVPASASS